MANLYILLTIIICIIGMGTCRGAQTLIMPLPGLVAGGKFFSLKENSK